MNTAILLDMPYEITRTGATLTLALAGDASDHPALLDQIGVDLVEPGVTLLVIDLAAVDTANSVLIGWLVRLSNAIGKQRMRVTGANPRVRHLLVRMRLDELFALV